MERRTFVKCMAAGAGWMAAPSALRAGTLRVRDAAPAVLVDPQGSPIQAESVLRGPGYIFHYPYITTPCFLLRLPERPQPLELLTEDDEPYQWPGGVGSDGKVVAFSAICAHKMAHPTQRVSYISYRSDVRDHGSGNGIISCCAEHSAYDPARGAEVLWGPASQPLATILLEHDAETDQLRAVGTAGGALFNEYFDEFRERLSFEYQTQDPVREVGDETTVHRMEDFTGNVIRCPIDPDAPEKQQEQYPEDPSPSI